MITGEDYKDPIVEVLRDIYRGLQEAFDQAQDEDLRAEDQLGGEVPTVGTVSDRLGYQIDRLDQAIGRLEGKEAAATEAEQVERLARAAHRLEAKTADEWSELEEDYRRVGGPYGYSRDGFYRWLDELEAAGPDAWKLRDPDMHSRNQPN